MLKPKDLLDSLESGDRSMEDLAGTNKSREALSEHINAGDMVTFDATLSEIARANWNAQNRVFNVGAAQQSLDNMAREHFARTQISGSSYAFAPQFFAQTREK